MKKYNHAFAIAFSIESDNEPNDVTANELLDALRDRLENLEKDYYQHGGEEIIEACGLPFDTYEN